MRAHSERLTKAEPVGEVDGSECMCDRHIRHRCSRSEPQGRCVDLSFLFHFTALAPTVLLEHSRLGSAVMWCSRRVLRTFSPTAMHCQQLFRCSRQLSAHALNSRATSLALAHRSSDQLVDEIFFVAPAILLGPATSVGYAACSHFRLARNKQRGGLNATSAAASTQSPPSTPPQCPPLAGPYDSFSVSFLPSVLLSS